MARLYLARGHFQAQRPVGKEEKITHTEADV